MGLVQSAGSAYTTTATNTVTGGSFTPTANSLVVAIAAIGNGAGTTITSQSISSTFGGTFGTWTQLVNVITPAGDGAAAIWVANAGSAPTAGTVTYTVAPASGPVDCCLIVRQFAGAKPAASQNGKTGSSTGTVTTTSITPNATGSQVIAARGASGTTTAPTAATNCTLYGGTAGGAGDSEGLVSYNSLTTAGVAQLSGSPLARSASRSRSRSLPRPCPGRCLGRRRSLVTACSCRRCSTSRQRLPRRCSGFPCHRTPASPRFRASSRTLAPPRSRWVRTRPRWPWERLTQPVPP